MQVVGRQGQGQKQQGAGVGEEEGVATRVLSMWEEGSGPKLESEGLQVVALHDVRVVEDAA
jgi:hypothetical protein